MSLPFPAAEVKPARVLRLHQQRKRRLRLTLALLVGAALTVALWVWVPSAAQASERGQRVERSHKQSCGCKVRKHKRHRKEHADHGKKHKRHGSRWHKKHRKERHGHHKRHVAKPRPVDRCKARDGGGRVCRKVCKPKRHVAPPVQRHKPPRWHKKHHRPKPRVIVDKPGFRDQPKPVQPTKPRAPTVILSPPVSKTAPKASKPKAPASQPVVAQTPGELPFTGPRDFLLPVGLGLVLLGALGLLAGSYKHRDRPVR